jgi:hypothetical protein
MSYLAQKIRQLMEQSGKKRLSEKEFIALISRLRVTRQDFPALELELRKLNLLHVIVEKKKKFFVF